MNEILDQSLDLLHKNEGNFWINKENKQLRYNSSQNGTPSWVNPVSVYAVGESTSGTYAGKIKKGQPVSVGLVGQLDSSKAGNGPSAVVVTDPGTDKWCIGIAMQPGLTENDDEIHVQSSGQVEYKLSNKDNDSYYLPPYTKNKFDWSYDDIGKPVYVSNKSKGELTLDIAEATYDGGTIICVGRIADAPLSTETRVDQQKILIEVQVSGDTRGVIDSTQITVTMAQLSGTLTFSAGNDVPLFIKVVNDKGYFVTKFADLNTTNQPVGAIVVTPESNGSSFTVDLSQYSGKDIVVTRLGVLEGSFGVEMADIGKVLYLNAQEKETAIDPVSLGYYSESDTVEFKVGLALDSDRLLIDCRYIKDYTKFSMIGTIKPVYSNDLVEPGYAFVDPSVIHTVYNDESGIAWEELIKSCYGKDIFLFSKDGKTFSKVNETTINDTTWSLNGDSNASGNATNKILDPVNNTYFKFRDMFYTLTENGETKTCACQIKYSKEGTDEDSQAYVWPEQTYNLTLEANSDKTALNVDKTYRINISSLVAAGKIIDHNDVDIEAYDIILQYLDSSSNAKTYYTPGFHEHTNSSGATDYYGFEWSITYDADRDATYLNMVLKPTGMKSESTAYGPALSYDGRFAEDTTFLVTVRRRPTQYNSFYLNQFPVINPWTPLQDSSGNLLSKGDKIYFGANLEANATSGTGFTSDGYGGYIEMSTSKTGANYEFVVKDSDSGTSSPVMTTTYTYKSKGNSDKQIVWTYDFSGTTPTANVNAVLPSSTYAYVGSYTASSYSVNALRALRYLKTKLLEKDTVKQLYFGKNDSDAKGGSQVSSSDSQYTLTPEDNGNDIVEDSQASSIALKDVDTTVINDYLYNGTSTVNYLTNIGLLNKSVIELEDRLYKMERAVLGYDASVTGNEYNSSLPARFFGRAGLLRIYNLLDKNLIFTESATQNSSKDTDKLSSQGAMNLGYVTSVSKDGFTSALYSYFVDNFGAYTDEDEYAVIAGSSTDDTSEKTTWPAAASLADFLNNNEDSHLKNLWFFYNSLYVVKKAGNAEFVFFAKSMDTEILNNYSEVNENGYYIVSSSIVPTIVAKKTNFKKGDAIDESLHFPFGGTLLRWPTYSDTEMSKGPLDPETNFFYSNFIGVSDSTEMEYNQYIGGFVPAENSYTFTAQSLDGWLLDIIIKISYLRSLFYFDHTMKNEGILYQPYIKVSIGEMNTIKYNHLSMVNLNDYDNNEGNTYSAFQFSNNKIIKAFSLYIKQKNPQLVFKNTTVNDTAATTLGSFADGYWDTSKSNIVDFNGSHLTNSAQVLMLEYISAVSRLETKIYDAIVNYPQYETSSEDGTTKLQYTYDELIAAVDKYNKYMLCLGQGYFDDQGKVEDNSIFIGGAFKLSQIRIRESKNGEIKTPTAYDVIYAHYYDDDIYKSNDQHELLYQKIAADQTDTIKDLFRVSEFYYDTDSGKFVAVSLNPSLCLVSNTTVTQCFSDGYDTYNDTDYLPANIKTATGQAKWALILKLSTGYVNNSSSYTSYLASKIKSTIENYSVVMSAFDLSQVKGNGHYIYHYWADDESISGLSEDEREETFLDKWPFFTNGVGQLLAAESKTKLDNYTFKVLFRENTTLQSGPDWTQIPFGEGSSHSWNDFVQRPVTKSEYAVDENDVINEDRVASDLGINASYVTKDRIKIGEAYKARYPGLSDSYTTLHEANVPTKSAYDTEKISIKSSAVAKDKEITALFSSFDLKTSKAGQAIADDTSNVSYNGVILGSGDYLEDVIFTFELSANDDPSLDSMLDIFSNNATNFVLMVNSVSYYKKRCVRTSYTSDDDSSTYKATVTLQFYNNNDSAYDSSLNGYGSGTLSVILYIEPATTTCLNLLNTSGTISYSGSFLVMNDNSTQLATYDNLTGKNVTYTVPTIDILTNESKVKTATQDTSYIPDNDEDPKWSTLTGYEASDSTNSTLKDLTHSLAFDKSALTYAKVHADIETASAGLSSVVENIYKTLYDRTAANNSVIKSLITSVQNCVSAMNDLVSHYNSLASTVEDVITKYNSYIQNTVSDAKLSTYKVTDFLQNTNQTNSVAVTTPTLDTQSDYDENKDALENYISKADNVKNVKSVTYNKAYFNRHNVRHYYISNELNRIKNDIYLNEFKATADGRTEHTALAVLDENNKVAYPGYTSRYTIMSSDWKFKAGAFITGTQLPEPDIFYKLRYNDIMRIIQLSYRTKPDLFTEQVDIQGLELIKPTIYHSRTLDHMIYMEFKYNGETYLLKVKNIFIADGQGYPITAFYSGNFGNIYGGLGHYDNFQFEVDITVINHTKESGGYFLYSVSNMGYIENQSEPAIKISKEESESISSIILTINENDFEYAKYILLRSSILCTSNGEYKKQDESSGNWDAANYDYGTIFSQVMKDYVSLSTVIDDFEFIYVGYTDPTIGS